MNPAAWYTSPLLIGLVTSFISQVAALCGHAIDDKALRLAVETCFQIIALLALVFAGHQRVTSPIAPLTFTKAGAVAATTPASELATAATNASLITNKETSK